MNPYNATIPGNLFVGYERLRRQLLNGFINGNSFAVLGGRRCGKTSLLMQIEQDIHAEGLKPFTPLPRRFSIQALGQLNPEQLFEKIYTLVVKNTPARPWTSSAPGRAYENFCTHLNKAHPFLKEVYGPRWLVLLLIDELDATVDKLRDDQFFQNLRNLLMEEYPARFRLVATGVNMANLIASGVSPLNILRPKYLGCLTAKQTDQLITYGFPEGLPLEVRASFLQKTGRHPFILQGLLEKLWDAKTNLTQETMEQASHDFLREQQQHAFSKWIEHFSPAAHAVYQQLAKAPNGTLPVRSLREDMDPTIAHEWEEGITFLSYHGVVDDTDPDAPQLVGTLFRDWYLNHVPGAPQRAESQPRPIRLFFSYAHKDEEYRETLEEHLAILKDLGAIESWHDREIMPGREWANMIDENLERADVILLLVSSSFMASKYIREVEVNRALERHKAGEARVIPIIIRDCMWEHASFGKLQALPKDAVPVDNWSSKDTAWKDVAEGIKRVAEQRRNNT